MESLWFMYGIAAKKKEKKKERTLLATKRVIVFFLLFYDGCQPALRCYYTTYYVGVSTSYWCYIIYNIFMCSINMISVYIYIITNPSIL